METNIINIKGLFNINSTVEFIGLKDVHKEARRQLLLFTLQRRNEKLPDNFHFNEAVLMYRQFVNEPKSFVYTVVREVYKRNVKEGVLDFLAYRLSIVNKEPIIVDTDLTSIEIRGLTSCTFILESDRSIASGRYPVLKMPVVPVPFPYSLVRTENSKVIQYISPNHNDLPRNVPHIVSYSPELVNLSDPAVGKFIFNYF